MLARIGTSSNEHPAPRSDAGSVECTQLALDALLGAQTAATRRPPFHVTPAHLLVGLMRQPRSSAGELLRRSGVAEDRVWAAFDYRRWRYHGIRRLRDPLLVRRPRWTRSAREVLTVAVRESASRETAVLDTIDLLTAVAAVGDPFATHLLAAARVGLVPETTVPDDAHLVELERSPTTQLPNLTALRRLRSAGH